MRMLLEDTIDLYNTYIVFTYPSDFPCDGKKVKRDLIAFRHWLRRKGVKHYFWGLEFQDRGAPHINFLIPNDISADSDQVKRAWFKIVGSSDSNHLIYGASVEPIRDKSKLKTYIVGYQYKAEQKTVPSEYQNVGRFWGSSESVKITGRYTKQFDTTEALELYLKPVTEFYEAKLREWSRDTGKQYKRQNSNFTMWGQAEVINQFIQKEKIYVEQTEN